MQKSVLFAVLLLCAARMSMADEVLPRDSESKVTSHIRADPHVRLSSGWTTFDVDHGDIRGWEYGGGGSASHPMTEPVELTVTARIGADAMELTIADDMKSIATHVHMPVGSRVVEHTQLPADHLTSDYQILWSADICDGDRVVKTVAYVARGIPLDDPSTGFDLAGAEKLRQMLIQTQTTAATAATRPAR